MKIVFFMRFYSYIAHYEKALRLLAQEGHAIHFAFDRLPRKPFDESRMKAMFDIPGATFDFLPDVRRSGLWSRFADLSHRLVDYLRYFHPDYTGVEKLRRRAERRLPSSLAFTASRFLVRTGGSAFWIRLLKGLEPVFPVPQAAANYLKNHRPELVMFTPLVDSNTPFIEYAKAAKALGIKSMICVASWDNLTNKGLIQADTDAVLVWNEFQKHEAVRYHSVDPSRIIVTGAQTFDVWFDKKPSLSKTEFMAKAGLGGCEEFLVYACSSGFIAREEVPFIQEWLRRIRQDPAFNRFAVLIRPHPANPQSWEKLEAHAFANVAVYPRWTGLPYPFCEEDKTDYFHTLCHAAAVVGINTSAMIEAGIHRKPVFTVLADEFKQTQEGTLHFRHLKDGGLLSVAGSLEGHLRQLKGILFDGGDRGAERIGAFIRKFVRPHGLDQAATPLVVQAVEDLLKRAKGSPSGEGPFIFLLRALAYPFILFGALFFWSEKKVEGASKKTGPRRPKVAAQLAVRDLLLMQGGDPLYGAFYKEGLDRIGIDDLKQRKKPRIYNSVQFFRQVFPLEGDVVECGCWHGFFSYLLCRYSQQKDASYSGEGFHIFDSFQGLPFPAPEDGLSPEKAGRTEGKFSAPLETVRRNLSLFPGIRYYPGWIPRTFEGLPERAYKFVHIDVDLYHSTKSSLEYFYPRLVPGGILICDDYASPAWPGAKRAVDEYCREHGLSSLALSTGQAVLFRPHAAARRAENKVSPEKVEVL